MNTTKQEDIYLGVDLGSTSIKILAIDSNEKIVGSKKIKSTPQNLASINEYDFEKHFNKRIKFICATGYGRKSLKSANYITSEIACQAKGLTSIYTGIGTIIDVGGQDTKIIRLDNNKIVDFYMNDKCASGTGRYIEKTASILGCSIEEMTKIKMEEKNLKPISSTCAVFAETEIISLMLEDLSVAAIANSVYCSLASRLMNTAMQFGLKEIVVFTGGLAKHTQLVNWMEKVRKGKIFVPLYLDSQITAAFGAALIGKNLVNNGD